MFRAQHGEAFPDIETTAITVGLGDLALRYILDNGGSGYFPLRVVEPLIAEGSLHLVAGAPRMRRPAYVVDRGTPKDDGVLQQALDALRDIALDAPG